jgi:uncharacterized SAM-binding protein YcdF (DUF218 family)
VRGLIVALVLPPLGLVLLALFGGLLALRGSRRGAWLAVLSCLALLVLATPLVSAVLTIGLERAVPPPLSDAPPAAIIVLSGEIARGQAGLEPGPLTLERLRTGAALAHRTGLPVLVSGGKILDRDPETMAALMTRSLKQDFGVAVRWQEDRSRDTAQNAALAAAVLREAGIQSAWLVTHSWHMARAAEAFRRAGFTVRPAPVRLFRQPYPVGWRDFVPVPEALQWNWFMLREWIGRLVYALRDG